MGREREREGERGGNGGKVEKGEREGKLCPTQNRNLAAKLRLQIIQLHLFKVMSGYRAALYPMRTETVTLSC